MQNLLISWLKEKKKKRIEALKVKSTLSWDSSS